jgi:hypothetical protein
LRKEADEPILAALARSTYWWYPAAMAAPMSGPTQKIHCNHKHSR